MVGIYSENSTVGVTKGRQLKAGLLKHSGHILSYLFATQSFGYLEKALYGSFIVIGSNRAHPEIELCKGARW